MGEYKVQIVGLAYFLREDGGRHVLFPDGRNIPDVTPHVATIAVAADQLAGNESFSGWREDQILRTPVSAAISGTGLDRELLQFVLSGDSIEIEGASSSSRNDEPLNVAAHDGVLQRLTDVVAGSDQPRVTIVPEEARTVADVRIRRGELRAVRFPGSDNDGTAAIISELHVPYEGDTVTITVRPKRGAISEPWSESDYRTITVRTGSEIEIAIVNASRPADGAGEDKTEHFRTYEQLAPGRLNLAQPQATPIDFPRSESKHLLFRAPGVIGSTVKCSNTCC